MSDASSSTTKPNPAAKSKALVLGPDGKPCKACTSLKDFSSTKKRLALPLSAKGKETECPPDKDALGRATWTFLHTTAAYYPESPKVGQRKQMLNLLNSLPTLYPCGVCADHLGNTMAENPPDKCVDSRAGVMKWLCERHNEVNELLGKERWKCDDVKSLDVRWRSGPADASCD